MRPKSSDSERSIELHWDNGRAAVAQEDEDRFVLAFQQAVSVSQGAATHQWLIHRFKTLFLQRIHAWCQKHAAQVEACHVPYPVTGECVKVFVRRTSQKFDFALNDSIADLEIVLENADWPCDILQFAPGSPEESAALFNPSQSIQIYGNSSRTQTKG